MTTLKRLARLSGAAVFCFLFQASFAFAQSKAAEIDLDQYVLSFSDEFDTIDVTEWGCTSRWIAHTPWAGDFGTARFAKPKEGFPFVVKDGILEIEARKSPSGQWWSGMLASWDACDSGFAQRYGYFEMRAKIPSGPGFWPAFWLIGVDKSNGTAEIDIFEHHTHKSHQYNSALMKHPGKNDMKRRVYSNFNPIEDGILAKQFNTFGADVSENEVVFYFNRKEVWRTPMLDHFKQPMYLLVSLAMDQGFVTSETPQSAKMQVDYVRAYQRKPKGF